MDIKIGQDLNTTLSEQNKQIQKLKKRAESPNVKVKERVFELKSEVQVDEKVIWDKKKLDFYNYNLEHGFVTDLPSPYHEGKFGYRKANIKYNMNEEEIEEYTKCVLDVLYFAENYCYTMTDNGQQLIKLRPYQVKVLTAYSENRNVCFVSSRQMGKTTTASIFLLWFALFNESKNTMVMADKGDTMIEVLEKIGIMYEYLPFFLKPGIEINQVKKKVFDNGCRIIGQNTTSRAGRSFTIHFLYCDEFAWIPKNIIEPFYHSVRPTLSSSDISRCIITSTPNGPNLFYKLYSSAVEGSDDAGKDSYYPLRVDWWEFPGRDENWKRAEIISLGSEEAFDQEYGCKFFTGNTTVIPETILGRIDRESIRPYEFVSIPQFSDKELQYSKLVWNKDYLDLFKNDFPGNYVISVDLSHGVGKNFTVINIFKVEMMRDSEIERIKLSQETEDVELFKLVQIGVLRDSFLAPDKAALILSELAFEFFDPNNVLLVVEENMGFDIIYNTLERHPEFFDEILYHSYHSKESKIKKPGLKISRNNKPLYITTFRDLVSTFKIEITHRETLDELKNMSQDKSGNYVVGIGNDDLFMSCSNLSSIFLDETIYDLIDNNRKFMDETQIKKINKLIYKNEHFEGITRSSQFDEFDFLDDF